ncbi:MAG: hypothetical protein ACTS9Y_00875 [Methylophilus sp.]|uniref:hypothetical protein n=1 Tax=Methylophilus sp. TaxID=29541 RepID=UPI003FA09E21
MFSLAEINLLVIQLVQSELKRDYETTRITYGLSVEVADTIKNATISQVREFTINSKTPLFAVAQPKDSKFWAEHANSVKHNIPRLDGIVAIRSIISTLHAAAA